MQAPVDRMELADSILRSTELALQFAGALTMAMAAFIILNTLRMNFGERRRDMAVLRVLGVTSGQIDSSPSDGRSALGLIGAMLGVPLGLAFGRGSEFGHATTRSRRCGPAGARVVDVADGADRRAARGLSGRARARDSVGPHLASRSAREIPRFAAASGFLCGRLAWD